MNHLRWGRDRRSSLVLFGVAVALLAGILGAERAAAQGRRWDDARRFRAPITVDAAGITRVDRTVEAVIDFDALLAGLGQTGAFDANSLRLVEVAAGGRALDEAVPFQFEPDTAGAGRGTLIFRLTGETAAAASRRYYVYFDVAGSAPGVAATEAIPTAPEAVTLTNATDEGFAAFKIATPRAIYYYHKAGGGFSSLVDEAGIDWINWNASPGNAGDFRGIPNMVHPNDGGFFHPGRTTSTSRVISKGTLKVTFESTSNDGLWKTRWEIFSDFARMTVLKAAGKYWFLYEGTPGGVLDGKDFVMRSNRKQTGAFVSWRGDLQGEEWAYVADSTANRSIFLLHHTQDNIIDSYKPSADRKMTIFGFGRDGNRRYQTAVPDQFSFGLVNSTAYDTVAQAVQEALNAPSAAVGSAEIKG